MLNTLITALLICVWRGKLIQTSKDKFWEKMIRASITGTVFEVKKKQVQNIAHISKKLLDKITVVDQLPSLVPSAQDPLSTSSS